MKSIKIGDTVYYRNDFNDITKGKVLQLLTNHDHTGKPYTVALVKTTSDKIIWHHVIEINYLTTDNTKYNKEQERIKIKEQIEQLQERLRTL